MSRWKDAREDRYDWEKTRGTITAFGQHKTLYEWARDARCVVKRETLRCRLALGWAPEDAITRAKHDKPSLEFTHNGRTLTLRGWADQSGISYHTLYGRINSRGMTFADALAKGADGPQCTVLVTAFGETKPLHQWGVDPRANCTAQTIRKRIRAGWNPEQAITEEPDHRPNLGKGVPFDAFGIRMGLEDWGRLSHIPPGMIKIRMDSHDLTLEAALRSLGWVLHDRDAGTPDLLQIRAQDLRPGDAIVAVTEETDSAGVCFTVRRIAMPVQPDTDRDDPHHQLFPVPR